MADYAQMKVTLLGFTTVTEETEEWLPHQEGTLPGDELAVFGGRVCYEAWHRGRPETADDADYLANIIEIGHESVLSHAGASFYLTGISRALTHELARHRFLSLSQRSMRYVDEGDFLPVEPPAIRDLEGPAGERARAKFWVAMRHSRAFYTSLVEELTGAGLPRKQAREAARSVLPHATETRIVVSGNYRAWRDFLKQRIVPGADAEIRELAGLLLVELHRLAPGTFSDLWAEYGDDRVSC